MKTIIGPSLHWIDQFCIHNEHQLIERLASSFWPSKLVRTNHAESATKLTSWYTTWIDQWLLVENGRKATKWGLDPNGLSFQQSLTYCFRALWSRRVVLSICSLVWRYSKIRHMIWKIANFLQRTQSLSGTLSHDIDKPRRWMMMSYWIALI